jgi:hypothetical protein
MESLKVRIVDPEGCTIEEYELHGKTYRCRAVHSTTFEPALFPGLIIDMAEVWES